MKKLLFFIFVSAFCTFSAFAQETETKQTEITEVVYQGKTFRKGDRVRVTSFAGTMKPDETGYSEEVTANQGKTGTIVGGRKREATSYFTPDPDEPIQIVLVDWDAQKWTSANGKMVTLKAFSSTIHVEYLQVVPKTVPKPKAKKTKRKS
ncbi:MAG TPA: hypothetical protein PKY59_21485 [Pyrinomonadaceae bacterium]|nr:hypothetical protein [Pyrinomonadaceae bacterium]